MLSLPCYGPYSHVSHRTFDVTVMEDLVEWMMIELCWRHYPLRDQFSEGMGRSSSLGLVAVRT